MAKVTKSKSVLHSLPMIIKGYIFASLVTFIDSFRRYCASKSFSTFFVSFDLEIRVKVTSIYSFFLPPNDTRLCVAIVNQSLQGI